MILVGRPLAKILLQAISFATTQTRKCLLRSNLGTSQSYVNVNLAYMCGKIERSSNAVKLTGRPAFLRDAQCQAVVTIVSKDQRALQTNSWFGTDRVMLSLSSTQLFSVSRP